MIELPAVDGTENMSKIGEPEPGSRWVSYHLFYHASLDLLLLELVLPVLRELWSRNRLRRFFFIRYPMGGPHVRLRLFGGPEDREAAAEVLARQAADFFARRPSTTPEDENVIRERNQRLLQSNPDEIDAVYPDNSFSELPFRPEVERYGGEALIERSLELFSLSSASTLALLESCASEERPRLLGAAMQVLLRQALGFAADGEELTRLVAYPIPDGGGPSLVTDRADKEFERQPESYVQLLSEEIESSFTLGPPYEPEGFLLTEASRRLKRHLEGVSAPVRWRILSSQLHMTANRLGLRNPEEVYFARILWRAAQEVSVSNPSLWQSLREAERKPGSSEAELADLIPQSLEELLREAPRRRLSQDT
jgi:hypothetical protein